jgi:tripartite-type tricarboxylate transporter receptor subunit TctC
MKNSEAELKNQAPRALAYLVCAFSLAAIPTVAHGQSDTFYKGKTIRFVVGSGAGAFYDLWGRLIARHWGKHIPGNPDVIVQNMPGASSITAANYVYGVTKPDGLSVVLPNNSIYIEQLVGRKEVQFDLRKFHWIGSASQDSIMFYMRADTPYKTIAGYRQSQTAAELRWIWDDQLRLHHRQDSRADRRGKDQ